jgi:hypothetical protein
VVLRGSDGVLSTAGAADLFGREGIDGLFGVVTLDPLVTSCEDAGRFGGGGGGGRFPAPGGGALKFFCWLRAAILSAKVVNCGSSTSAIARIAV